MRWIEEAARRSIKAKSHPRNQLYLLNTPVAGSPGGGLLRIYPTERQDGSEVALRAVERCQVAADAREVDEAIDRAQQAIGRHWFSSENS